MPSLLPDGPIDTFGVLEAVLGLPEQLAAASDAGPVADLPGGTRFDAVVVSGPGQAITAAEIVAALAMPVAAVPVLVHGGGPLPAFVSARTLVAVLAVDDDPAALDAARVALDRHASVVAVAPPHSALAGTDGTLHLPVAADVPVARAGVGALAVHGLQLLEQVGLLAEVAPMVSAAVAQLERRRDELTADAGPAARLARRIGRTLPIVYASDDLGSVAARRWKRQVNLDAKAAAFANALPHLAHDEVAGWGQHGDMTRQVFSLVTLRHDHEPSGTEGRLRAVEDLLDEVVHERHEVVAAGDGMLAQLLDLVFYGDVTAWHLAQELEIDPGPTAAVTAVWSSS